MDSQSLQNFQGRCFQESSLDPGKLWLQASPMGMGGWGPSTAPATVHVVSVTDSSTEAFYAELSQVAGRRGDAVVRLDRQQGLADLTTLLSSRFASGSLQSLRLYSHGTAGRFEIGAETVSGDTLTGQQDDFAKLGSLLAEQGDLLIYGCEVGKGQRGRDLLQTLAAATSADVAASSDLTGNSSVGADWILEESIGNIESVSDEDVDDVAWSGTLAVSPGALVGSGQANYIDANGDRVDLELRDANGALLPNQFRITLAGGATDRADATAIDLSAAASDARLSIRVTPQLLNINANASSADPGANGRYNRYYSSGYTNIDRIFSNAPNGRLGSIGLSGAIVKTIDLKGYDIDNVVIDTAYSVFADAVNSSSSASSNNVHSPNIDISHVATGAELEVVDESPVGPTGSAYNPTTGLIDLGDLRAKSIGALVVNGSISADTKDPNDQAALTNDLRGTITVAERIGSIEAQRSALSGEIRAASIGRVNLGLIQGKLITTDPAQALTIKLPSEFRGLIDAAGPLNLGFNFDGSTRDVKTSIVERFFGEIRSAGGISGLSSSDVDTIYLPNNIFSVFRNTSSTQNIADVVINGTGSSRWISSSGIGNITANSFSESMLVDAVGNIGNLEALRSKPGGNVAAASPIAAPIAIELQGTYKAGGSIGNVKSATSIAADLRAGGSIGDLTALSGGIRSSLIEAGSNIGNLWVHKNTVVNNGKIVAKSGNIGDLYLGVGDWGGSLNAGQNIGNIKLVKGNLLLAKIHAGSSIGAISVAGSLQGGSIVSGINIGQIDVLASTGHAISGVLIQAGRQAGQRITGVKAVSLGASRLPAVKPGLNPVALSAHDAIQNSQILAGEIGPVLAQSYTGSGIVDTVIHAQASDCDAITGLGVASGLLRVTATAALDLGAIEGRSDVQGEGISQSRFNANSGAIGSVVAQGGMAGGHGLAATYLQAQSSIGDIAATSHSNQGDAIHQLTAYAAVFGSIKAQVVGGEGAVPVEPPPPSAARILTGSGISGSYFKALRAGSVAIRAIDVDVDSMYGQGIRNSKFTVKGDVGSINVKSLNNVAIIDSEFSSSAGDFAGVTATAANVGSAILRSSFSSDSGNIGPVDAASLATASVSHAIQAANFKAANNIGAIAALSRSGTAIKDSTFIADSDLSSSGSIDAVTAISEGDHLSLSSGIAGSRFAATSIGRRSSDADSNHGVNVEIRGFEGGAGISDSTFTARTATYDGMGNYDNRGSIGNITVKNGSRVGNGIERSRFTAGAGGRIDDIDVNNNLQWDPVDLDQDGSFWDQKNNPTSGKGIYLSTFQASSFDLDQNLFSGKIGNVTVRAGRVQPLLLPNLTAPNDQSTLAAAGIDQSYFAAYGGIGDIAIDTVGTAVFGSAFLADFDVVDTTNLIGFVFSKMAASVRGSIGDIAIRTRGRFASGSVLSVFTGAGIGAVAVEANASTVQQAPQQLLTPASPIEKTVLDLIRGALAFVPGATAVFDSVLQSNSRKGLAAVVGSVFAALHQDIASVSIRNSGATRKSALFSIFLAKNSLGDTRFTPKLERNGFTSFLAEVVANFISPALGYPASTIYDTDGVLLTGRHRMLPPDSQMPSSLPSATLLLPSTARPYGVGSSLSFRANFDGPVVVKGLPTIALKLGAVNRSAIYESGSGTTSLTFKYQVQPADVASLGEFSVVETIQSDALKNTISYQAGGTPIVSASLSVQGRPGRIVVDGIAPRIKEFQAPDTIPATVGSEVKVSVIFTEPVNVSGTPLIDATIGDNLPIRLSYSQGSGTNTLVFRAVLRRADVQQNRRFRIQPTIRLASSQVRIQDTSGNAAALSLAAPPVG